MITIADSLRQEGFEIGMRESTIEIASKMAFEGMDDDLIHRVTGLSIDVIQEFREQIYSHQTA